MEKQKCCAGQEVIWNKCELWDLLYCPSLFTVNRYSHCGFKKIGFLCLFVYVHVHVCVYIYTCTWGKIKDTEVVGKQTCQQGAVWSLQSTAGTPVWTHFQHNLIIQRYQSFLFA